MDEQLGALLKRGHGVVTRAEAGQVVPPWIFDAACRKGQLRRLLPGVYVDADLPHEPALLQRAAAQYVDGRGALSHTTALDVWGLRQSDASDPVHLSVPPQVRLRTQPRLTIHHRSDFAVEPPHVMTRQGMPVTSLERAIVDSWPLLPPAERPAPLIRAVNGWHTTPDRVTAALVRAPTLPDRAALRRLLSRLAAGCRSPLEVWGHDHVFTGPDMPEFQRQVRVCVDGFVYYLDVYAEQERVNFELDGAASHGTPGCREADLRRDVLLATVGILPVRFSSYRLYYETAAVRRDALRILAARRNGGP